MSDKTKGITLVVSTEEFAGKVAFVTGAANGIGRATAIAFARAGANVALADIDTAGIEVTAAYIREVGRKVLALTCDVTVEGDVKAALAQTVRDFGALDIAFNNAGKFQKVAPLAETEGDEWRRIMDINVSSTFFCMRNEIPIMLERGGGVIVNTSSGAGIVGTKGGAVYGAAKHAVIGLTRSAALDYATAGIRINAVCPGVIETNMMREVSGGTAAGRSAMVDLEPVGRLGQPEEIASAVLWLCSSGASFAVGHALVVDGGHTIQ
jgi:NAD(P)-dependent dehydrogenase (short-subunit alcohol dehydrogenase family)